MHVTRFFTFLLLLLVLFPAAATSRTLDAAPNSDYRLAIDAFLKPDHTVLRVKVSSDSAKLPDHLEKLQVKIWPRGDGPVDVSNESDVAAPGGVATVRLPRLSLLQRVEVRAHVKNGSQNALEAENVVQYEQLGAVSSDHPLATAAGEGVLKKGGNAFDAAAAMLFVLNVVQPSLAGIGGGSEVVVHVSSEGKDYAIVGREKSPADTPASLYDGRVRGIVGLNGYSVGVPGTLRTVETMLDRWGTISLADALQPAIGHAEQGFRVGEFLAKDAALARTALLQPEVTARFRPGGVPLAQGATLVQRDLAETFKLIAREGTSVFYGGEIAQAIVEAQKKTAVGANAIPDGAGRMTLADLAAYDVDVRPASHLDYKGYDVYSAPPPSNGGVVLLETLGLLEQRFPIGDVATGYGFGTRNTVHAMVEALRLALPDRDKWIGDPAAGAVPEAQLLSDSYLAARASLLNPYPVRMSGVPGPGNPLAFLSASDPDESPVEAGEGHTTHFSVIDRFGNVVSFTTTLRDSFGSGIMVQPYGFVLNNTLSLFNIPRRADTTANDAGPNKRPMGSQTPTVIVKNGEPIAGTGTYGAEFIPSLVVNIVLDLIDHKLALQDAVDASRIWMSQPPPVQPAAAGSFAWNYASRPGAPTFDQFCPPLPDNNCNGVIQDLRAIGHVASRRPGVNDPTFGSLASVAVDPATFALQGAADSLRQRDATAVVVPR
jgi:gamma-glutamyltranspeptidase / glutathione hydrolase